MKNVRVRIAPSPTGYPHVGTAWQGLFNWGFAKRFNGKFIIRIEDTDQERLVEDAEEKLYEALDWLGLEEDESPRKGGPFEPYTQSERLALYRKHAEQLVDQGDAYYCFCSQERLNKLREQQKLQGKLPKYDQHCRNLPEEEVKKKLKEGEEYVIRMKIPDNETIVVNDLIRGKVKFESKILDDQVLLKSDGYPTYHLAVVVDDHLMKISHIVRGEEWLSSAPKHVLLYRYFDWEMPKVVHTPILRNPDKSKLSKRQGHTNIVWFQEQGFLPQAMLNFLAILGWSHPQEKEFFSMDEFTAHVHLKDLSPVGPVFNLDKLDWLNGKYIRKMDQEDFNHAVEEYSDLPIQKIDKDLIFPLLQERIKRLANVDDWLEFLFKDIEYDEEELLKNGGNAGLVKEQFKKIVQELEKIEDWKTKQIGEVLRKIVVDREDWDTGQYFMALRVAITGSSISLPLFESIEELGKQKTLDRLREVSRSV
jgi:glutamyl-tRNA synthetase